MTKSKGYGMDNLVSATDKDIVDAPELEIMTGTKASTWRYWAHIGSGPPSFRLGRRRVWRKSDVLAWIATQEAATSTGGSAA